MKWCLMSIEKTTFLIVKPNIYHMILIVIGKQNFMTKKGASVALPAEKGDHFNLNWGGPKERG